jgi:ABC-type transport system substrate-binding protein
MIAVQFEGKGYINNAVPAGLPSWWLDPRSVDMGPSAKYFRRDVDAARKLLAEAGFADGLRVPMISTLNGYGNIFNASIELVIRQLKDAGIQAELRAQDYAAYSSSTILGKFDGGTIVWGRMGTYQDPHDYLTNWYHPKGIRNNAGVNDPKLTDMIEQQAMTLDKAARKRLIFDIQRYLGEQQYYVIGPIGQQTVAYQPWVKSFNYQSDNGRGGEYIPRLFLDGKPK